MVWLALIQHLHEDLTHNLPQVLSELSVFIQREAIRQTLPDRDTIAEVDGRWVRRKTDWRNLYSDEVLHRFYELNGAAQAQMGYDTD